MARLQLLLLSLVTALGHPLIQAVQVQASFVLLVGTIGWALSGLRRGREAARLKAAGYAEALQEAEAAAAAQATSKVATAASAAVFDVHACSAGAGVAGNAQQQQQLLAEATIQQQGSSLKHRASCRASDAGAAVPAAASQVSSKQQPQQGKLAASAHSIYKSRPPGSQAAWPPLAVVCPVKGCRPHSSHNWATQLAAHYGGPRVFVFVVEAAADPAVAALQDMMAQHVPQQQQQQQQACFSALPGRVLHAWRQRPQQAVLLLDAGLAHSCSQKIHNILAGIEVALAAMDQQQQQQPTQPTQADELQYNHHNSRQQAQEQGLGMQLCSAGSPSSTAWSCSHSRSSSSSSSGGGYVAVLDDDVALHPLSLCQLVDEMQADPALFMATGFPFDIVAAACSSNAGSTGSGGGWLGRLLAYAAASYHLPLLIGFSVADRGGFVWGGAMLLRAAELRKAAAEEAAGVAAAAEAEAGKLAAGSSAAAKPNILQVWRQGGYSDDLLLAAYCSQHRLAIGSPASAYFPQQLPPSYTPQQYWNYLRRQVYVLDTYHGTANKALNHTMMAAHSYASALFAAAVLASSLQLLSLAVTAAVLLLQHVQQWRAAVPGEGVWAAGRSGSSSSSSDADLSQVQQLLSSCTSLGTWVFVGLTVSSLAAIRYLVLQVLVLFRVLSPDAGPEVLQPHISLSLLWLGWVLESAVLPFCMLYSFCCGHIVWGGITYFKQGGRVRKVVHPRRQ